MQDRTVRIGDEDLRITRFRGLKAIVASAMVARVMREVPEIQQRLLEFADKYRKEHQIVINPGMAKLPRFAGLGFTSEDFEAAGGNIVIPQDPTGQEVFIAIMPDLLELARKELMRFLALIAIPNRDLESADDADEVDTALDREGKRLFRTGELDQLMELGIVGWEVLQDQILSKQDRLGKLKQLPFVRMLLSTPEQGEEPEKNAEEMETPSEEIPQTSPNDQPGSPSDSPSSADGTEEPLSTVSPGTS